MFLVNFGPFWVQSGLSDVTKGVKILKFWNSDLIIGFLTQKNVSMPIFRSKQSFNRDLLCFWSILGHFEWWQNGQISFLAVGGYFLDDLAKLKLSIILEYCCEHVLGSPFFWFWLWGVIDPPLQSKFSILNGINYKIFSEICMLNHTFLKINC